MSIDILDEVRAARRRAGDVPSAAAAVAWGAAVSEAWDKMSAAQGATDIRAARAALIDLAAAAVAMVEHIDRKIAAVKAAKGGEP